MFLSFPLFARRNRLSADDIGVLPCQPTEVNAVLAERTSEETRSRERTALPVIESLDELERYVLQEPEVCVRYSAGPHADRSRPSVDYESGLLLPGLSVTPLRPESWWTRDRRDWIARQLCHYVHLKEQGRGREAWLLIGRVAGYGPDREPLLWPWTPVAVVAESVIEEARGRYEQNFHRGQDSTDDED
jgi:hypothetical protein